MSNVNQKRIKTKYPGVFYRIRNRIGRPGIEKVYFIVFKKNGKLFEEQVGRQYIDDMTPARAAHIRSERIEGLRLSRKELKQVLENRWTVNRLWKEYKKRNPNIKGIIQDQNRFDKYISPIFGEKEISNLTSADIDNFRINLLKTKKPATVKNILELLRRIGTFGLKKQLCDGFNFTIEMPKVNNQKTEDLTLEQLRKLLHVLENDQNKDTADFMKMVLFTGMRRGELFRLQWKDIDLEKGFITIRDPKGSEDQSIPLSDEAITVLINRPKAKTPYVFPGKDGKQRVDIRKSMNRIKREAGLPTDFRALHGLRHVYASMLASSGKVELYTLQKLLTHKSSAMTQRYAHLRDEALKNASNVAADIINTTRDD